MAKQITRLQSVGFARQSDLNTENTTDGDFDYLRSRVVIREDAREVEEVDYASNQIGVREAPVPQGSLPGTLTIGGVIEGFKDGYAAATDVLGTTDDVVSPIVQHIINALGSDGNTAVAAASDYTKGKHGYTRGYVSGDVFAAPGNNVVTVNTPASYNEGELFCSETAEDGVSPCVGWVSDVDGGGALTLFEDPQNQPVPGDDVLGCIVGYLSNAARVPLTCRIMGANAAFKVGFIGCTPQSLKCTFAADKPPMYEVVWRYIHRTDYASGGGLQTLAEFDRIPPWNGDQYGALTYGTPYVSTSTGGTGAAVCGWEEIELTVEWPLVGEPCPSKVGGISEFTYGDPEIKLTAKVPKDSSDGVTLGQNPYERALSEGTAKSIIIYHGSIPGKIMSVKLQSMRLMTAVGIEDTDGRLKYATEWRPSRYSADTGTTDPANAPVAIGWC